METSTEEDIEDHGDDEGDDATGSPDHVALVTLTSAPGIVSYVLIPAVDCVVEELDWVLAKLGRHMRARVDKRHGAKGSSSFGKHEKAVVGDALLIEEAVYAQMRNVVSVCTTLVTTNYNEWSTTELTIRLVTKVFRLLTTATKVLHVNRVLPSYKFQNLIKVSNRELTSSVYDLLFHLARCCTNAKNELRVVSTLSNRVLHSI